MILKPQDIYILLKLVAMGESHWSYASVAGGLFMSASEVHAGIKRAVAARLMPAQGSQPLKKSLEEFLIHGVKYAFRPDHGGLTRGVPTGCAAPPLAEFPFANLQGIAGRRCLSRRAPRPSFPGPGEPGAPAAAHQAIAGNSGDVKTRERLRKIGYELRIKRHFMGVSGEFMKKTVIVTLMILAVSSSALCQLQIIGSWYAETGSEYSVRLTFREGGKGIMGCWDLDSESMETFFRSWSFKWTCSGNRIVLIGLPWRCSLDLNKNESSLEPDVSGNKCNSYLLQAPFVNSNVTDDRKYYVERWSLYKSKEFHLKHQRN